MATATPQEIIQRQNGSRDGAPKYFGRAVMIHPDSYTRGEGSNCTVSIELLYATQLRVLLSSDRRDRKHGLHRVVSGIIPEMHPTPHVPQEPRL